MVFLSAFCVSDRQSVHHRAKLKKVARSCLAIGVERIGQGRQGTRRYMTEAQVNAYYIPDVRVDTSFLCLKYKV